MFTKTAIALAIVFCSVTGALAATKKHSANPTPNANGTYDGSQGFNYRGDDEYWRRFRYMGDYN